MSIVNPGPREPMVGDPDDHRPGSTWRLVVNPGDAEGVVETFAVIDEHIAPGDRIPLHTHDVDELVIVLAGKGETRLGDQRQGIGPGSIVFVPAGARHGTANTPGASALEIHGIFPSTTIEIRMLERNPAPGTEADPPRGLRYDLGTGGFEVLD